jgi:GT2 family glycosyltransferase
MREVSVVIPNWNGKDSLKACLDSLLIQSLKPTIIVVENGSTDGSNKFLADTYPDIVVLEQQRNLGFAGGVNVGIRYAIENNHQFVALFNNDAVADKAWLKNLHQELLDNSHSGIATCKFMDIENKHIDSTGDLYTIWGLPYPRGRGEEVSNQYDEQTDIFAASGGASLYRVKMLQEIGLFDEDFFAYYEDVDLSFRAQLAGWKISYVPSSIAYHQIGATSSKIKGFTTYQTMKNLPWLLWKNVPASLLFRTVPRFTLAYTSFLISAAQRGQSAPALKGVLISVLLLPKKILQRWQIQHKRKVSVDYINSVLTHDLPPNAHKLRALRNTWWKISRHKAYS